MPCFPRHPALALAAAAAIALTLGCAASVDAAPAARAYVADAENCKPASPAQLAWLKDDAWRKYAPYVRACSVRDGHAAAGLLIVSVWEGPYYADQPSGSTEAEMPHPLLFTPDGRPLGELPTNFPSEESSSIALRFAQWKNGLPGEIHVCVKGPQPGGNYSMTPLRLAASGRYEFAGDPSATSPRDECHAQ
jgi:hypothetical protein